MPERQRWLPTWGGGFLILFSGVYTLFGYSLLTVDVTPPVRHQFSVLLAIAPLWVYAAAWLLAAVVGLIAGLTRHLEAAAYGSIAIMPFLWATIYGVSWLHDKIPNGWVEAAVFYGLAGAVRCVAGMDEPVTTQQIQDVAGSTREPGE